MKTQFAPIFRGIGIRSSVRTVEALRTLTEHIIKLIRNYREVAVASVKSGSMRVYVPATLDDATLDGFFGQLQTIVSQGNINGEPCYADLESGNKGRNDDGTEHGSFLIVDPIERLVVDLVDDKGKTMLRTALVQFWSPEQVVTHK